MLKVARGLNGQQVGQQKLVDESLGFVLVDQIIMDANSTETKERRDEHMGLQLVDMGDGDPLAPVCLDEPQRQIDNPRSCRMLERIPELCRR